MGRLRQLLIAVAIAGAYALGEYDRSPVIPAPRHESWASVPDTLDWMERAERSQSELTNAAHSLTRFTSPSTIYELMRHQRAVRSSRQFSDNSLNLERLLALDPAARSGPVMESQPHPRGPVGFALLYIGGEQLLEGSWDGGGHFTVTRWRGFGGIGPGNFAILDARDVKRITWHESITFMDAHESGREISRLYNERETSKR